MGIAALAVNKGGGPARSSGKRDGPADGMQGALSIVPYSSTRGYSEVAVVGGADGVICSGHILGAGRASSFKAANRPVLASGAFLRADRVGREEASPPFARCHIITSVWASPGEFLWRLQSATTRRPPWA